MPTHPNIGTYLHVTSMVKDPCRVGTLWQGAAQANPPPPLLQCTVHTMAHITCDR